MSGKEKIAVIFDIDGTLVYSERKDSQTFAATYERIYGKPFPTIDWKQFPHVTDTAIFKTVINQHFDRPVEAIEVDYFQQQYVRSLNIRRKENPHHYKAIPYARNMLSRLKNEGRYEIAIATGGWSLPAHVKLDHIDIDASSLKISAADGKETREAILQEAIHSLNGAMNNIKKVVYIGDAEWDVHTTRNMQLSFVGVRWRGDFGTLKQEGATQVIQDYRGYNDFLSAIENAKPPILK